MPLSIFQTKIYQSLKLRSINNSMLFALPAAQVWVNMVSFVASKILPAKT